jgi:two-component system chemotaxis response regulator CheY
MKILAVDDSSTIRDIVSETLFNYGYGDCTTATDGWDALEKVDETEDPFEFFIIDINMPNMDGFELISNLRNKFVYLSTPIMVLTTERSEKMKQKGREVGATSWIVKPFDKERFIQGIKLTLEYVENNETF